MKIAAAVLGIFCSLCLLSTGLSQDCSSVNFGNDVATIVNLPPVCTDSSLSVEPQCCSSDYIQGRVDEIRNQFITALREEVEGPFDLFQRVARIIREFLDGNFLTGLFNSFGRIDFLTDSSEVIARYVEEFRNNFDINITANGQTFDVSEFFERYVNEIKEDAVNQYASFLGQGTRDCIRDLIQRNIDSARMIAFARTLEVLRRVRTSLDKLATFLDNFQLDLQGFTPLDQCVDRVVDVVDCGSCLGVVRPLCLNWCGALARACYSPFYEVIGMQFDRFWQTVGEILGEIPDIWAALNENRRIFTLGISGIPAALGECGVDFSDFIGKRQTNDNNPLLPNFPTLDSLPLRGLLTYGGGPRFCRSFFSTARSNCRNGDMNEGNDIDEFDNNDIEGQVSNPAIQIDQALLQERARALGSPVDTFLDSEAFTSTSPGGGSLGLTATISLLVAALLVALAMN